MKNWKRGDHLRVDRVFYWHHGIFTGEGRVIHFSGEPAEKEDAQIRYDSYEKFAQRGKVEPVEYSRCNSPDETIRIAEGFLHKKDYGLFSNNCEHFCSYCKTHKRRSAQVENTRACVTAAGGGAGAAAAVGAVSLAGTTAGASTVAGVTSGLAAIGASLAGRGDCGPGRAGRSDHRNRLPRARLQRRTSARTGAAGPPGRKAWDGAGGRGRNCGYGCGGFHDGHHGGDRHGGRRHLWARSRRRHARRRCRGGCAAGGGRPDRVCGLQVFQEVKLGSLRTSTTNPEAIHGGSSRSSAASGNSSGKLSCGSCVRKFAGCWPGLAEKCDNRRRIENSTR